MNVSHNEGMNIPAIDRQPFDNETESQIESVAGVVSLNHAICTRPIVGQIILTFSLHPIEKLSLAPTYFFFILFVQTHVMGK